MKSEDILDEFFVHSRVPLVQPNQQHPYAQQPHTPSNRVATESSTAMSASASSHEGEAAQSHLCAGGQAVAEGMRVNDKFDQPTIMASSGIHSNSKRNYVETNPQISSAMPALYAGGLRSHQEQQQQQQQQQQQYLAKDAMCLHGLEHFSNALIQVIEHFKECNEKSMQLLQIAQASFLPNSSLLALLQPIVSHLNTDLNTLTVLRNAFITNGMASQATSSVYPPLAPRADGRDPLLSQATMSTPTKEQQQQLHHLHQQQQQQQQPAYHAGFAKSKGPGVGAEASGACSLSGIWCMPESRAGPAAEAEGSAGAVPASLPSFHDSALQAQLQPSSSLGAAEEWFGKDDARAAVDVMQSRNEYQPAAAALSPVSGEDTWGGQGQPKCLAFVEFKRNRVRKYECDPSISPGVYVLVDGDRGKDCGLIVQTSKTEPDGTTVVACMDCARVNADKIKLEKGRVLGLASAEDVDMLHNSIPLAEQQALEMCKKKCNEMGISIQLIDCEYQFDREKVSFYFNSEHSVDFRPLVRELYRTFHVRIWMENTNPNVKNAMPTSESSAGANGGGYNSNGDEMKVEAGLLNEYNYTQGKNKSVSVGNGRDGSIGARNGAGGRGSRGRRGRNKA